MKYRRLGRSGPSISVIGMGCWGIGGSAKEWGWEAQDDRESIRTVHRALELGINWFDTAPTYGLGHSEEVLGRALKSTRHEAVVASKFGRTWDANGHLGRCGRYDWIIQECDASLKCLDMDYIDIYQMHWPDTETGVPVEESMRAAADLLRAGKVRFVGACNFDVELLQRAMVACPLASLQPRYNMFDRTSESELIPFCREHDIGVVAYSPLASGLLGGSMSEDSRFVEGDWRKNDSDFTGDRFKHNLARAERLRRIADGVGLSVAQFAVAWVLRDDAITSAIVGMRRPGHIEDVVKAADQTLLPDVLERIDESLPGDEP